MLDDGYYWKWHKIVCCFVTKWIGRQRNSEQKKLNNILIPFTIKNITEIRWQLLFVAFETNELCEIHVKYMLGNMKMFSYCYNKWGACIVIIRIVELNEIGSSTCLVDLCNMAFIDDVKMLLVFAFSAHKIVLWLLMRCGADRKFLKWVFRWINWTEIKIDTMNTQFFQV